MPQKLSRKAAKDKARRDLGYAKSPYRTGIKAANQKRRREKLEELTKRFGSVTKAKAWLSKRDWDHEDRRWESRSMNRGNDGNGTKSEGKRKYKA
jgi:hypothetical protein